MPIEEEDLKGMTTKRFQEIIEEAAKLHQKINPRRRRKKEPASEQALRETTIYIN